MMSQCTGHKPRWVREARNGIHRNTNSATTPASFGAWLYVAKDDARDGGNEQQQQGRAADKDVDEAGIIR